MAIARAQLVDVSLTRWYHCVTRCVRRASLLGEGDHNRKQWLQNRLEELAEIFAVSVGGFSAELAASDREASRGPLAGPILRGQPREVARNRRTPRCASPGQPEGLSDSMTAP